MEGQKPSRFGGEQFVPVVDVVSLRGEGAAAVSFITTYDRMPLSEEPLGDRDSPELTGGFYRILVDSRLTNEEKALELKRIADKALTYGASPDNIKHAYAVAYDVFMREKGSKLK